MVRRFHAMLRESVAHLMPGHVDPLLNGMEEFDMDWHGRPSSVRENEPQYQLTTTTEADTNLAEDISNSAAETNSADTPAAETNLTAGRPDPVYPRTAAAAKHPLLSPCACIRLLCHTKLTEEQRSELWREFWELNYESQRLWISSHCSRENVKQRKTDAENKKRNVSYQYQLNGVMVCKQMFLRTIGFKSDKILTVTLNSNSACDARGSHENRPKKLKLDVTEIIKDHINSFEPGISHYRRAHAPKRLYIDPSVSIMDMHRLYKQQENDKAVSYESYYRVVSSMNISFAKLGHEQCETHLEHDEHLKNTGCNNTTHTQNTKHNTVAP